MSRPCASCGEALELAQIFCPVCGFPQHSPPPPVFHSPPSAVLSGRVRALRREGFEVGRPDGSWVLVTTLTDGRRLDLRVGEAVSVHGGFDAHANFASGGITAGEGVSARNVPDAPAPRRWFWQAPRQKK